MVVYNDQNYSKEKQNEQYENNTSAVKHHIKLGNDAICGSYEHVQRLRERIKFNTRTKYNWPECIII